MITLQYCIGICPTSTWISHGIYMFAGIYFHEALGSELTDEYGSSQIWPILKKNPYFNVHLSTSNDLFLYSRYFILSLGFCSNFTGNTWCLPFSLLPGLPFLSFNWQHWALPYWGQFLFLFCMPAQSLSCVRLFVSLWTVAHQAPLSMGVSRQESWSGLPCPPPGDLPSPGIESVLCLMSPALPSRFFTTSAICEALAPLLVLSKYIYLWIKVSWVVLVRKNPLPMEEM